MNNNINNIREYLKTLDSNNPIYEKIEDLVNNNYTNDTLMEKLKEIEASNECPPELKTMINNIENENIPLAENSEESKEEPEVINDENLNNVQHLLNPSLEHLKTVYKNIRDSQNSDFKLNVEIKYEDNNNVIIDMGYKDNDGNDYTIVKASYNDINIEEFNKNELEFLLNDHSELGVKAVEEESEEKIVSENTLGETLSIEGDREIVKDTPQILKDNKQQVKSDNKVKVYKIGSMNNAAYSNSSIYIVLFATLLIIIIITVLFILLK